MTASLRIAIVGSGIAGVAAAIHLRRLGHAIDHFEGRPGVDTGGAGLLLQPPALGLLRELGIGADDLHFGARIDGFGAEDLHGRTLTHIRYADYAPGSYGLGIQRRYLIERLHDLDRAREHVRFSHAATSVDAQRGIVHLANASECGPYDLIVAADGASSALRRANPRLVRRDQVNPSAALVACIDDPEGLAGTHLVQYFDGTRHVAVWSVGSTGEGEPRRLNVSLNIPLQEARSFLASGTWKGLIGRHCPRLAPMVGGLDDVFSPIIYAYRDVSLHRMVSGRIAFIGDAAHSMSPLLGQGARLALHDAKVLARSLQSHTDLPAALDAFDRDARSKAEEFQRISRWITPVFQSDSRLLAGVRYWVQVAHRLPFVARGVRELLLGDSR